ncbi:dioxygenase [Sphingomonas sp. KC8]|nr:dioxygenase [Sphingomonas sp. KC8]
MTENAGTERPRLSASSLGQLPPGIARPAYRRDAVGGGIVHLGIGAFHRAHQAVYTDDALAAGDAKWGITAVSLRSAAVRDAMQPQDGLYSVVERGAAGERLRIIGAVRNVLVAPESPEAVVAALADPDTHVVTLTVTEKGYGRNPATGQLDDGQSALIGDLRGDANPATIHGFLAAALARRRTNGAGGLTLLSCDNLAGNGRLLGGLLAEFLDRRDPALAAWAATAISCPNTMVDRIVPATAMCDRDGLERVLGVEDQAMVVTEPFRQWVIEDRFAGPRPQWEAGGAQFVQDVRPFELAKLRLLNGSHSTLAYFGLGLGYHFVHEAIGDDDLARFVDVQMADEVVPGLPVCGGLDPLAYMAALQARFGNPALPHRLSQIAMDGSQKVPQRWLSTMIERAAHGLESPAHMLSLAAWVVYTRGRAADGSTYAVNDPLAARLASLWNAAGDDAAQLAGLFVDRSGVFPAAFVGNPQLRGQFVTALRAILTGGHRAALAAFLARQNRI